MKKFVLFVVLAAAAVGALYPFRFMFQKYLAEGLINTSTREFFGGSVRLKSIFIDRKIKLHLQGMEGLLQSEGGPVKLELQRVESETLLPDLFSKGAVFYFSGIRPLESQNPGIQGRSELRVGPNWFYKIEGTIDGVDISEVQWLNPENLKNSAGLLKGNFKINATADQPDPQFSAVLLAGSGGYLQARLFETLLPYLPQLPTKERLEKLAGDNKRVQFRDAALRLDLAAANRLKIILHISIPDYNVDLNINLEIHLEEKTSFLELAQVLGLVKVRHETL